MSEELHDLRTKIPTETLSVLHALEMAMGESMAEITRQWIIERAAAELKKATLICRVLNGKGDAGHIGGKL